MNVLELKSAGRRALGDGHYKARQHSASERSGDPASGPDKRQKDFRDSVLERAFNRKREDDLSEHGHFLPRNSITNCMSRQTILLISLLPSLRMT